MTLRLEILNNNQSPIQKAVLKVLGAVAGHVPGPALVMSYRRNFFGKPFAGVLHESMRGGKEWKKSEVEIFAAFVSKLNNCDY